MNCEEYEILLSARLDGALTPEETARLEAHLAQCPQCRRLAQELETLQAQTAALTQEVPRALRRTWRAGTGPGPPDGHRPSQKKKRLLPWAACARDRRRPDGFWLHPPGPSGGGGGLSEGLRRPFLPAGDREESTATAEDSTQSADPEEEASDQTDGATPPDDGAAEGTPTPPQTAPVKGTKTTGTPPQTPLRSPQRRPWRPAGGPRQ